MRRLKLVSEIYKKAKEENINMGTFAFLLSTMTDKTLTKFHNEFMNKVCKAEIK